LAERELKRAIELSPNLFEAHHIYSHLLMVIGQPQGSYEQARAALVGECETAGRIALARFRDLLGVGRKTAQLLLERFDADGLTRRIGDERVLRRRGTLSQ